MPHRGGLPSRQAACHPERRHHAKGYCASCYRVFSRRHTDNPVRATCHPGRPHRAGGLCDSCYTVKKNKKNPEKRVRLTRAATLRVYGLTTEDYDRMCREQQGLCAICHRPPKEGKHLSVDHRHLTGKVRQLLCRNCKTGIENFDENTEFLKSAIVYLEKHNGISDAVNQLIENTKNAKESDVLPRLQVH
jgi:hypothetical protein